MNNERNEMLGYNGHRTGCSAEGGGARSRDNFPYGQMPEPKGDLRSAPRLDMNVSPRRKCTGEVQEDSTLPTPTHGWGLQNYPLAMVYSPYQNWQKLYTPDVALERGTLFSELDLPLDPTNCKRGC